MWLRILFQQTKYSLLWYWIYLFFGWPNSLTLLKAFAYPISNLTLLVFKRVRSNQVNLILQYIFQKSNLWNLWIDQRKLLSIASPEKLWLTKSQKPGNPSRLKITCFLLCTTVQLLDRFLNVFFANSISKDGLLLVYCIRFQDLDLNFKTFCACPSLAYNLFAIRHT